MLPLTVEDRLNATTDCGGLFEIQALVGQYSRP